MLFCQAFKSGAPLSKTNYDVGQYWEDMATNNILNSSIYLVHSARHCCDYSSLAPMHHLTALDNSTSTTRGADWLIDSLCDAHWLGFNFYRETRQVSQLELGGEGRFKGLDPGTHTPMASGGILHN